MKRVRSVGWRRSETPPDRIAPAVSPARPLPLLAVPTMSHRQSLPVIGRLLTVAAAMVAVAGISDCARFGSVTRDGALDGRLLPAARVRATLGDVMSGAAGTYIDR